MISWLILIMPVKLYNMSQMDLKKCRRAGFEPASVYVESKKRYVKFVRVVHFAQDKTIRRENMISRNLSQNKIRRKGYNTTKISPKGLLGLELISSEGIAEGEA